MQQKRSCPWPSRRLEQDTFQLTVGQHVHQFYPGVNTTTFGVNGPYLGPTLLMHRGDTARLKVINELPQVTSMHWHGMHVPGDMDGGPQREVHRPVRIGM
jgi:FtsP/CotA-like multicopper oxidase with cupredoxin domain